MAVVFSVSVSAQSAKKYYKSGEEFFEAQKYSDAVTQFTNAIGLDPNYKDSWYIRGLSYENLKDFKNAAVFLHRLLFY